MSQLRSLWKLIKDFFNRYKFWIGLVLGLVLSLLFCTGCSAPPEPVGDSSEVIQDNLEKAQSDNVGLSSITCPHGVDPTELVPITQLESYVAASNPGLTVSGKLYDGSNEKSSALAARFDAAVLSALSADARTLVAEGMSNARDEFDGLADSLDADSNVHDDFKFENLAEGGCDGSGWIEDDCGDIHKPRSEVGGVLLKHSLNRKQTGFQTFPGNALNLKEVLLTRFDQLVDEYPNLEFIVLTSRTYGGWGCENNQNREPTSYEEGFGVKWAIEDWNDDTSNPPAIWGAYIYDPTWPRSWFKDDAIHPDEGAVDAVSGLFMNFFRTDTSMSKFVFGSSSPHPFPGWSLSVAVSGSGEVAKSPDKPFYDPGETVTLTAASDPPSVFDRWAGDLTSSNPVESLFMDSNKAVSASFVDTTSSGGGGSGLDTIRVDCGGDGFGEFLPDFGFLQGESMSCCGKNDPTGSGIYAQARGGDYILYEFDVKPGIYTVKLHWFEHFNKDRSATVGINGVVVEDDLNPLDICGNQTGCFTTYGNVDASSGQIEIEVIREDRKPRLYGIEILGN